MNQKEKGLSISPAPEVLVSRSQETEYCAAHQIELRRLPNGITIVGIPREVSDAARASINFTFPSGAFFDPPGKAGLHHLVEHLGEHSLSPGIRELVTRLRVTLNAFTDWGNITETCSGPANPAVKDFGVWPLLPTIRRVLASPLSFFGNLQTALENEKEVIKAEIAENQASHNRQAQEYFYKVVFGPSHPLAINVLGTPESLASITPDDVTKLIKEVFIPQGLIISILSEGKPEITRQLTEELTPIFGDFPRANQKNREINWLLLENLNPDFHSGEIYEKDTGLKNGLISLMFVWSLQPPAFTSSQFGLSLMTQELSGRFLQFCRQQGWGYSAGAWQTTPGLSTTALVLQLDVPKQSLSEMRRFQKKVLSGTKQKVIRVLAGHQLEEIVKTEKARQKATPLLTSQYLDWTLMGQRRWGRLIEADQIKALFEQIKIADLAAWQEQILNQKPAMILVGDLS